MRQRSMFLIPLAAHGVLACKFPELPPILDDAAIDGPVDPDALPIDGPPMQRDIVVDVDPASGQGVVRAPSVGIDCGTFCNAQALDGTVIPFTASSVAGTALAGWRQDAISCGASAMCELTVPGATLNVGARFAIIGQAAWTVQVGDSAIEEVLHVAPTPDGGVVMAASFRGDLRFDGATYLGGGVLLAKVSSAGDVIWKKAIANLGTVNAPIDGVVVHRESGDIIIAGSYTSTLDLGGPLLSLPVADTRDAFVARFDRDGMWKWQRHIAVSDRDEHVVGSATVDSNGDIYVAGSFTEWIDFGDGRLTTSANEGFVAKLSSSNDTVVWKRKLGGETAGANAEAVAVDATGHLVVAGAFSGSGTFGGATLTASGTADGYIASYVGTNGTFRWQRRVGGTGQDAVRALAGDSASGRIYAAVSYATVSGEPVTFGGAPVTGTGGAAEDCVLGALQPGDGSIAWARRYGGSGSDGPNAVAVLADASIAMVGSYGADIQFGAATLTHAGVGDGFLVRMSSADGSATFSGRLSSGANDVLNSVAGTTNEIVVGGHFSAQAAVLGRTVTPVGNRDGVVAAVIPTPEQML